MEWLPVSDVEQIVQLVSRAGDPTIDVFMPERKRELLEGLATLVDADIWYWSTAMLNPEIPGDSAVTSFVDGGWRGEEERTTFLQVLSDPNHRPLAAKFLGSDRDRHITRSLGQYPTGDLRRAIQAVFRDAGIGHFLISQYPVSDLSDSCVCFYRRLSRPAFSERDRAIVHVIVSQVDWLHYHGMDVPAKDVVLKLSRREREVMFFLLGGDTQKVVARKLSLSEHTIGGHIKQIYKRFSVGSRAELLSHFISGGQT